MLTSISMSHIYRRLPVDFIVAVDPGYATQGISIYACDPQGPRPICSRATVTDNSIDIWERIEFQFSHIHALLDWLGSENILLVLEEYHTSGKTSHKATYYRAFYDALFRERLIPRVKYAVTIHPMNVRKLSCIDKNHKTFDGSPLGLLKYMGHLFPEVFHPSILTLMSEFHQLFYVGKKPPNRKTKNTWVSHCADAGMMGMIGATAFVYDGFLSRFDVKQQEKIKALQEAYTFQEEPCRTYR